MRSPFNHHDHHGHRHHRSGGFDDPRMGFGGPPPPPFPPDPEMPFPPMGPPAPWGRGRGGGRRGGPHHGPGGRQRRGNVRAAVLALLAERPMHGYEMIQELGQRTDGVWRPSPGSVYPTLQMLADEGLVTATEEAGGKKLFTLTEAGTAQAAQNEGATPWEQVNDEVDVVAAKLRTASRHLGSAMQQMAHAGTREQKGRAVEVLNEARRKIYAILGELDVEEDTDSPE
jgi:DNA-binding PadR family transcriptional regulator